MGDWVLTTRQGLVLGFVLSAALWLAIGAGLRAAFGAELHSGDKLIGGGTPSITLPDSGSIMLQTAPDNYITIMECGSVEATASSLPFCLMSMKDAKKGQILVGDPKTNTWKWVYPEKAK